MKTRFTTEVYYDEQAAAAGEPGWAYRTDVHGKWAGLSGGLDGYETEAELSRAEAIALARQALEQDRSATRVRVYWHGEREPIEFAADELGREAAPVTDAQIEALRSEAGSADDEARAECARVIAAAS